VDFVGNTAFSDGRLQRRLKENKPKGIISFITGSGTYKENEYEADIERVVEFYQNHGYARARIGQPELKTVETSKDGKSRWIELKIPVTEGPRYKFGDFGFSGNTIFKTEGLRPALQRRGQGRVVQPQEGGRRPQEEPGSVRAVRLHGVHRLPGLHLQRRPDVEDTLANQIPEALRAPPEPRRPSSRRRSPTSPCGSKRGRSTSSTASPSPATPPRATT
jgi:hypothetical protein